MEAVKDGRGPGIESSPLLQLIQHLCLHAGPFMPGPGCKTSPVWALLMPAMGVPTKQECWHHVSCLWQAHGLDSGTSESPPSPRLHVPSHWVVRIILASLGRLVFIDQLQRGGKGLLQIAPRSVLAALLFGWDCLEKDRDHLQSCTPHPTRPPRADAGSPVPWGRAGWEPKPVRHGDPYGQSCLQMRGCKKQIHYVFLCSLPKQQSM